GASTNPAQILCSRFENGSFSAPVQVVTDLPGPNLFGFGGFDLAVFGQQVYVSFERNSQGILLARSDDGGKNFLPPVPVQAPAPGAFVTLSTITTDETGRIYIAYINDATPATHQICRSDDGGESFTLPVNAGAPSDGEAVCECCPSALLTDADTVWMAYRNNNSNIRDHWISRSSDAGASFDRAIDVDSTDWLLQFCPVSGPSLALAGNSLVCAWVSGASGVNRVYVSSADRALAFPGVQRSFLTTNGPSVAQGQVDICASGDTIGLVFQEKNSQIVFVYSTSGLSNLGNQMELLTVPNHLLRYPSVLFRNGVFHVTYLDVNAHQIVYRTAGFATSGLAPEPEFPISIYPNPADGGAFEVQLPGDLNGSWRLISNVGKLVASDELRGSSFWVNVPEAEAGLYVLVVMTNRGMFSKSIMIGF
ncbi:MAG: T9SS type A sorting domain-containing protein, partial [Saprospiraceae bacterium]|nr:T9SS type A sorting domain-containing protein [Saprospiraceae bacterium]